MKVTFHHSYVPTCLQRKLWIGCLPRRSFAWMLRRVHELARKHMICLRAHGLQTMICLHVDRQGLQGLQTFEMFASTWLERISYVSKPGKIIPFLFEGIGPLNHAQISIHMIWFSLSSGFLLNQQQHLYWKISITLHHHLYFCLRVMILSPQ